MAVRGLGKMRARQIRPHQLHDVESAGDGSGLPAATPGMVGAGVAGWACWLECCAGHWFDVDDGLMRM
jgi:hypothetical protein